jgi:hypothetical protein
MTPERLQECMRILNLAPSDLAFVIDRDLRRIRRWRSGESAVPDNIAIWLEGWVAYTEEHPSPSPHPVQLFDLLHELAQARRWTGAVE